MELDLENVTLEEEHENAFKDSPERRLLSAVMNRAVTDFLCDSDPKHQEEAKDWIFEPLTDAPEPFSFQYVCMELDVDPEQAQIALTKLESGVRAA